MINKKKIIKAAVAMSGGVDSSVAAALLKKSGYDVSGFFMRLNNFSSEAEKRAKKVTEILNIPFYVFDFRKEFKKKIINNFLEEYKKRITPNPCVVCNKEIKFGLLLEKALKLGADYVATGHYARLWQAGQNFKLLKGKDKKKEQSYFLWQLNQKKLKYILFPVGNYTKSHVRKLAKKFNLPTFETPESQEICFVPKTINPFRGQRGLTEIQRKKTSNGVNDFLKKYFKENPGQIIDTRGKSLGRHEGLFFYTIGQRKGIKLSGGPYYVLDKDLRKNLLIVTKNERDLYKKELALRSANWILGKEPKLPLKIKAKIRYRQEPGFATLTYNLKLKTYNLKFDKPQRAITPGQSAVFYRGNEVLGGGIIIN